jgi:hypothetical protein
MLALGLVRVKTSFKLSLLWRFSLGQKISIINDHDHTGRRYCAELYRSEHRDANAAVAGRDEWNRWIAMNSYIAVNIIRKVEQSEQTLSPAFQFAINLESASVCDRPRRASGQAQLDTPLAIESREIDD